MYSELLRYSGNRAYAELVLSADLFEQLHLRSPIQRVPPSRADACIRVPIRLEGGPKQNAELDQIRIPKSDFASRILQQRDTHSKQNKSDAWGLIAARLGKKKNRQSFV